MTETLGFLDMTNLHSTINNNDFILVSMYLA